MDALKIISEGSIKLKSPSSTLAIPSALTFASRKASVSVSRLSRAPSLLRSTAALQRPLPFAAFPTVSALSVSSPSTAPSLRRSPLSARARFAAPSCSICVVVPARLLRSRAIFDDPRVKPGEKGQLVVPFFLYSGPDKIVRCIGKWKSMLQHRKLCADRMCLSGTRR